MDCALCQEETETKEDGICIDCQQKVLKAFGVKVEFLDEEPHIRVIPKEKQMLYEFVYQLSRLFASVDYNFHSIEHHSHSTKTVGVVDIE